MSSIVRDTIYRAAINILKNHGATGFTMDKVAKEAELSKGTLYNYFKDKNSLLLYIEEGVLDPIYKNIEDIAVRNISCTEKISAITESLFSDFEDNRALFLVISEVGGPFTPAHCRRRRKCISIIVRKIIEYGMGNGEFEEVDAISISEMFIGSIIGLMQYKLEVGLQVNFDKEVELLLNIFLTKLKKQ